MIKFALFLVILIGIKSNTLIPIDWELCENKDSRRAIPSIADPIKRRFAKEDYDVKIIDIKVNSAELSIGQEAIFHISAILKSGTLVNPILNVQVFNKENGMKFLNFPMYSVCAQSNSVCPVEPDEDKEIVVAITQSIPWVHSSMIGKEFDVVAHLEDGGEVIKCVKFAIKLKE